jgi:hypothetical protein
MLLYNLNHNGYTFGQKRGKSKAVKALKNHLDFMGISLDKRKWKTLSSGIISISILDAYDTFSIEENKDKI